jgi:hypothetical protein
VRLVKREGDDVLVFARDASLDKSQKHGPVFVLGVNASRTVPGPRDQRVLMWPDTKVTRSCPGYWIDERMDGVFGLLRL